MIRVEKGCVSVQILEKVAWISELLFREMLLGVQNIISFFDGVELAFKHIIYCEIRRAIVANMAYVY